MSQIEEDLQVKISTTDLIYAQGKELSRRMDNLERRMDVTRQELNQRMDRLEVRMNKLDEKLDETRRELAGQIRAQDAKIEKLADKIDALHNELKNSTGHISIANISTVGIALAVIYSLIR